MEEEIKNKIASVIGLTDEWEDGTYLYYLTRVKSAFALGTMILDDFEEVNYELVEEIFKEIKPYLNL